jgi:hypothetical protein
MTGTYKNKEDRNARDRARRMEKKQANDLEASKEESYEDYGEVFIQQSNPKQPDVLPNAIPISKYRFY